MSYVSVPVVWAMFTWLVPAEPLIKDRVREGVQQDKDGIIRGEVSLPAGPVEEEVRKVVEAADHWVIQTRGGAVALKNIKQKSP